MKNLKLVTAITALFFLLLSACKDEPDGPAYNPNPDLAEVDSTVFCNDPALRNWLLQQYVGWGGLEEILLATSGQLTMDQVTLMHALYFENSAANQSFGPEGEYTDRLNKTFADLKRFWDIDGDKIVMVATHGSVLQDRTKVIATYKAQYGYPDQKTNAFADSVATLLELYPQYLNGNHPAFSFNQLATPDTILAGVGRVPAKIIIGDGVLQGFDAIGYRDIAPQAILAHEYAHHIQYGLGVLTKGMQRGKELIPKTARRIELMADAYAAYYLSHPRGAAMQGESMQKALEVFFNLGDCLFEDDSHHGTPDQRKAAAQWGSNLANDARKQDHILPGREFARLFDAALADIVKK